MEFKDFSTDKAFPISREQTFAPVITNFNDNVFARFGLVIAEFLYPPFLIEEVIEIPKVEQKTNFTPFLLGFFVLLSILLGIICGIRWYLLCRERKRLNQFPLYSRLPELNNNEQELPLAACVLEQEQEGQAAPSLPIAENIAENGTNEPVIDAVPIEVTDNVEYGMKETCDSEFIPSNCDDNKIMACEHGEQTQVIPTEPVGTTERIVRKRFPRQPVDRKQVTTKTEPMARKPTVRKPYIPEPVLRKNKTDRK